MGVLVWLYTQESRHPGGQTRVSDPLELGLPPLMGAVRQNSGPPKKLCVFSTVELGLVLLREGPM